MRSPSTTTREQSPLSETREKPIYNNEDTAQPKINKFLHLKIFHQQGWRIISCCWSLQVKVMALVCGQETPLGSALTQSPPKAQPGADSISGPRCPVKRFGKPGVNNLVVIESTPVTTPCSVPWLPLFFHLSNPLREESNV